MTYGWNTCPAKLACSVRRLPGKIGRINRPRSIVWISPHITHVFP